MKCPRCQALVSAPPDASGLVVCPACGARLRSKPAPAAAPVAKTPPAPRTPAPPAPPPLDAESTMVSARQLKAAPPSGEAAPSPLATAVSEQVLAELRALREGQEEILSLLRGGAPRLHSEPAFAGFTGHAAEPDADEVPAAAPPVVRSRRRKTVLLVDDDEGARAEAQAALEKAEVPVRVVGDGHAGLGAIAAEKPDVIVLELDMGGSMGGKDVVNMIKATMEWIDIPIVLYTRLPIDGQKEARQVHGADEVVCKGPGSADVLVSRVISVFRRG